MRAGKGGEPIAQIEMMELVGAYEMANRPQGLHRGAKLRDQLDRRPDPEIAAVQTHDDGARRIREADPVDNAALDHPEILVDRLQPDAR